MQLTSLHMWIDLNKACMCGLMFGPLPQAEAANVINTVASAAEGYPFVPPEWAPAVFTPLVGLVLPAIGMATLFVYM